MASFAQKVKFKKNKVTLDKVEILKYTEDGEFGVYRYYVSELDSSEDKILLVMSSNETHQFLADDYIQIKFLTLGKMAEIKSRSPENMILMMMKAGVISSDGKKINEDKIDMFIKNYDENITARTVRH